MNMSVAIEKIVGSDFYKSLVQEEVSKTIEQRKDAVEAIKTLDKESLKIQRNFQAKISKKEEELKAVKANAKKLQKELNRLGAEKSSASNMYHTQKSSLEHFLRKTADGRIDEALYLFRQKQRDLRSSKIYTEVVGKKRNWATLNFDKKYDSNAPEIESALDFTRHGIKMLGEMRLDAVLNEEKLKTLVAGITSRAKALRIG